MKMRVRSFLMAGLVCLGLLVPPVIAAGEPAREIVGFEPVETPELWLKVGDGEAEIRQLLDALPDTVTARTVVLEEVPSETLPETIPEQPQEETAESQLPVVEAIPVPESGEQPAPTEESQVLEESLVHEAAATQEEPVRVTWRAAETSTTEVPGTFTCIAEIRGVDRDRFVLADGVAMPELTVPVKEVPREELTPEQRAAMLAGLQDHPVLLTEEDVFAAAPELEAAAMRPSLMSTGTPETACSYLQSEDNENNAGTGEADGDLKDYVGRGSPHHPIEVNVNIPEGMLPTQSCYIAVRTFDVDWRYGEYDELRVNGHKVGVLSGLNDDWNTSFYPVPISFLKEGDNLIEVIIYHSNAWSEQKYEAEDPRLSTADMWYVTIDWVQLVCDGGSRGNIKNYGIELLDARATDSEAQISAKMTVDIEGEYATEYSITDPKGFMRGSYQNPTATGSEEFIISMPKDCMDGEYTVTGLLKNREGAVLASDTKTLRVEAGIPRLVPTISYELLPGGWTNQDVQASLCVDPGQTTNFQFTDSGLQTPEPINGKYYYELTFPSNETRTYEYSYTDLKGQPAKRSYTIVVGNIDRTAPEIHYVPVTVMEGTLNEELTGILQRSLSAKDDDSGVTEEVSFTLPENFCGNAGAHSFTASVRDVAGNLTEKEITVNVVGEPTTLSKTTAEDGKGFTLTAELTAVGNAAIKESGFVYGAFQNPTVSMNHGTIVNAPAVSTKGGKLTGHVADDKLVAGLKYYARAYLKTASGAVIYGPQSEPFGLGLPKYGTIHVKDKGSGKFEIYRDATETEGAQKVYFRTQNGSAVAGTHYTAQAGTEVIPAGQTSVTVTVTESGANTVKSGQPVTTGYTKTGFNRNYFFEVYRIDGGAAKGSDVRISHTMTSSKTISPDVFSSAYKTKTRSGEVQHGDNQDDKWGWDKDLTYDSTHGIETVDVVTMGLAERNYWSALADTDLCYKATFDTKETNKGYQRMQVIQGQTLDTTFGATEGSWDGTWTGSDNGEAKAAYRCKFEHGGSGGANTTYYNRTMPGGLGRTSNPNEAPTEDFKDGRNGTGCILLPASSSNSQYISVGFTASGEKEDKWWTRNMVHHVKLQDQREPKLIETAPMDQSTYRPGDTFTVALVFDEIVHSANGLQVAVGNWAASTLDLKGGLGTNVLYFEGTVKAGASGAFDVSIVGDGLKNVRDMCEGGSAADTNAFQSGSNGTVNSDELKAVIQNPEIQNGTASATIVKPSNCGACTVEYAWTESSAIPTGGWAAVPSGGTVTNRQTSGKWYLHARVFRAEDGAEAFSSEIFDFGTPENPTSPLPKLEASADNAGWAHSKTITVTRSPAAAKVTYTKPGVTAGTELKEHSLQVTENGIYTFSMEVDGEVLQTAVTITGIDCKAPTVTLSEPGSGVHNSITLSAQAEDDLSGVQSVQYCFHTAKEPPAEGWLSASAPQNEKYIFNYEEASATEATTKYLHVRATDRAGNQITETSKGFQVIKPSAAKPAITLTGGASAGWTKGPVTLTWKVTDQGAGGCSILVNGKSVSAASGTISAAENGKYTVLVRDQNGTTASASLVVNGIDAEAPSAQAEILAVSGTSAKKTIQISQVTDARSKQFRDDGSFQGYGGSGVQSVKWKKDTALDTGWQTLTVAGGTYSFVVVENGAYQVRLTDVAGNADTYTVQVNDIVTPTLTFDSNSGSAVDSITAAAGTTITLPTPTRAGYTFDGWFANEGCTGDRYTSTVMPEADATLYAKWTANTDTAYTVKHLWQNVNDDGYTEHETENQTGTTAAPTAAEAKTYDGFTAQAITQSNIQGDGTTVVEIRYDRNLYTLTWNLDGGSTTSADDDYTHGSIRYGAAITVPVAPTKTGYTFQGWGTDPAATMPAANTTYTAQWTVNSYTLSFDAEGGSAVTAITKNFGEMVTKPDDPTRTGYTFDGWYEQADFSGNAYSFTTMPAENKTLHAKWTANHYTVTFDGNGSTGGSTASQDFIYDEAEKALTANGFAKTGYTFAGWATSADGNAVYQNGEAVQNLTSAANGTVDLYAQWTANRYTVKFDGNGSTSGTMADQSFTYDEAKKALTANGFAKTGYTFAGWNTQADGKGTPYEDQTEVQNLSSTARGTVTLYAQWTANHYTVIYDGNGSTDGTTESQAFTYDEALKALTINGYTKTGYTFASWNTQADGKGTSYADQAEVQNLSSDVDGQATLYAQWTANRYTVKFDGNGSTSGTMADQSFTYDEAEKALTANGFAKTGYTFAGWATGREGAVTYHDQAAVQNLTNQADGTVTLYAKWTVIPYAITYHLNGGTVDPENKTTYTIETETFALTNPARPGYTFAGWTGTGLEKASTGVTVTQGSTEARDYTANWTLNTMTSVEKAVTYGGETVTGDSVVYQNKDLVLRVTPSHDDGEVTYAYQWQKKTAEDGEYTDLVGETASQLTIPAADAETAWYQCVITAEGSRTGTGTATTGTSVEQKITVSKLKIFARWTETVQTYTGQDLRPRVEPAGLLEGDELTITADARRAAGTVLLNTTLSGADAGNYILSNPKANFTVQKAPVGFSVTRTQAKFNEGPQEAEVAAASQNVEDFTAFTVSYYNSDGEKLSQLPVAAGEYDIRARLEDDNFRHANGTDGAERSIGTFRIYQDQPKPQFTVSFAGGEGTVTGSTSALAEAIETTVRTLPPCGFERSGYQFAGWELGGRTYRPGESFVQPGQAVTMTALWKENTYHISGVVSQDGTPVANAVVTLNLGSQRIQETVTDERGQYRFSELVPGLYNLRADYDGIVKTVQAEIIDGDRPANVDLPLKKTNSVVDVTEGTPIIVVGKLEESFQTVDPEVYTAEDRKIVDAGGEVEIKFTAEKQNEDADNSQQEAISQQAPNVGLFLDLTVTKTVTDADGSKDEAKSGLITDSKVLYRATIWLPANLQNMYSYSIHRWHEGEVQTLTTSPNEDGEYFEVLAEENKIVLHVRKFSTYAIGYVETAPSSGGSSNSSYRVTVADTEHGTAAADRTRAYRSQKVTVNIRPDKGWMTDQVTVISEYGKELPVTRESGTHYSFRQPAGNVTVYVTFRPYVAEPAETGVDKLLDVSGKHPYLNGYADETFRPERYMTRAHVAQMFYNLLLDKDIPTTASFTDVPKGAWCEQAVGTLQALGIMKGVTKTEFCPNRPITRAEFAVTAMRFAQLPKNETASFTDVLETDWFYDQVAGAVSYGWIQGYPDGSFRPYQKITRAQAAVITNRMLGRLPDRSRLDEHPDQQRTFADANPAYWAYDDIREATAHS